jgi:hypothetical protein
MRKVCSATTSHEAMGTEATTLAPEFGSPAVSAPQADAS